MLERDGLSIGVDRRIRQIEIAAPGRFIGKHLAAGQPQCVGDAVPQAFVEDFVSLSLNRQVSSS